VTKLGIIEARWIIEFSLDRGSRFVFGHRWIIRLYLFRSNRNPWGLAVFDAKWRTASVKETATARGGASWGRHFTGLPWGGWRPVVLPGDPSAIRSTPQSDICQDKWTGGLASAELLASGKFER
jgi:hypothetical protein